MQHSSIRAMHAMLIQQLWAMQQFHWNIAGMKITAGHRPKSAHRAWLACRLLQQPATSPTKSWVSIISRRVLNNNYCEAKRWVGEFSVQWSFWWWLQQAQRWVKSELFLTMAAYLAGLTRLVGHIANYHSIDSLLPFMNYCNNWSS